MATHTVARTKSATLGANAADTVTLTSPGFGFRVVNRSNGAGTIWVRYDGVTPTVGGDDCYPVDGSQYFTLPDSMALAAVTVKLICTAAADYTVEA